MGRIRRGVLRFQHKALGLFLPVKDSQLHVREAIVASRQAVRGGCLKTLLTGRIDGEVVEQER